MALGVRELPELAVGRDQVDVGRRVAAVERQGSLVRGDRLRLAALRLEPEALLQLPVLVAPDREQLRHLRVGDGRSLAAASLGRLEVPLGIRLPSQPLVRERKGVANGSRAGRQLRRAEVRAERGLGLAGRIVRPAQAVMGRRAGRNGPGRFFEQLPTLGEPLLGQQRLGAADLRRQGVRAKRQRFAEAARGGGVAPERRLGRARVIGPPPVPAIERRRAPVGREGLPI